MVSSLLEELLLLLLLKVLFLLMLEETLAALDEIAKIREVFWGVGVKNTWRYCHRVVVVVVVGGGRR